ncbi:MAG: hypothetical protein ACPGSD_01090 [Flavobacteriales bacterium]
MKKTILLALLSSAFMITSCNNDDESSSTITDPDPIEENTKLFNNWECTSITVKGEALNTGIKVGTFTGTGYDLSDFEVEFVETGKTVSKQGDYSLDIDVVSDFITQTDFDLPDQDVFPEGTFTDNKDGTITIKPVTGNDILCDVVTSTDVELKLKADLSLTYAVPSVGNVNLPTEATFTFKAK